MKEEQAYQAALRIVDKSCVTWAEIFIPPKFYFDLVKDTRGWHRSDVKDDQPLSVLPAGRKRRSKSDKIQPSDVMRMRKRKMSWTAIAKYYGVSMPTLKKALSLK